MVTELTTQGEQVIALVQKVGEMRIAPSDTRCRAVGTKGARCKKPIFYEEESDTWMRFCEKHYGQLEKSRVGEGKAPKVFEGGDE